jgi:hypothetical protein
VVQSKWLSLNYSGCFVCCFLVVVAMSALAGALVLTSKINEKFVILPVIFSGFYSCPAGKMAATTSGLSSVGQCVDCTPGYTCTAGRGPVGSNKSPVACGSSGNTIFYCPGGNQVSTRATPQGGYYASNPAGSGNTFTAQSACPAGSYCPGTGQKIPCPAGKYGSSDQLWQNSQCEGGCAAGYNCPAGSSNKFEEACAPNLANVNDARTYYCPAGQGRLQINAGTEYTTPENGLEGFRTGKSSCASAEFCSNGKRERRVSWTGDWASCAPSAGGAATFTFAEGNDADGMNTPGDFTEENVTASTPTGSSISYSVDGGDSECRQSWTNTAGSYNGANTGQFEISGTTLRLKDSVTTPVGPGLSFENCRPPDGYSVLVKASVGTYSETCKVTVKVGDVNEKPIIPAGQSFSVPENSDPTTTCNGGVVTATDSEVDNGVQALTWTIVSGCTKQGSNTELTGLCPFVIGICDGQLRVATSQYLVVKPTPALDYESSDWRRVYTLTVKANDDGPGGGQVGIETVTLSITDVNEPPAISGSSDGGTAFTVNELTGISQGAVLDGNSGQIAASDVDTAGGHDTQLTFTHNAANAANVPFSVSATGLATVDLADESTTGGINFDGPGAKRVHNLIVSVKDSGWGSNPPNPLPAAAAVTITVTVVDENDPPAIDPVWEWTGNAAIDTVLVFPEDCVGAGPSAAGSGLPSCTKQLTQTDPDDTTTGIDDTPGFNSNNDG